MKVILRRDTKENWEKYNPVLKKNEIVKIFFKNDLPKFKIGDGFSKYSDLPFVEGDKFVIDANTPFITGNFEIRFDVNLDGSLPNE